ncbi:unnamed protein product, partial [Callosobruchus maculatus]
TGVCPSQQTPSSFHSSLNAAYCTAQHMPVPLSTSQPLICYKYTYIKTRTNTYQL